MIKYAWNSDDTDISAMLASVAGGGAYVARHPRLNDFNPFGKKRVRVVGGVKPWSYHARQEAADILTRASRGETIPPDVLSRAAKVFALDSFSGQSHAVADAFKRSGMNTTLVRSSINSPVKTVESALGQSKVFDLHDFYRPRPLTERDILGADAIVQVGDSASHGTLEKARRRGAGIYRVLTDYGDGNFLQPDEWLGGQNWMKIRNPKLYDRLFIPGGAEADLWGNIPSGRKANVNIGDIAVSPIFKNMQFERHSGPGTKAMLTIGGGAGASLSLRNYSAKENARYNFIGRDRTLFDDILSALRHKHGDNVNLNVFLGSSISKPQNIRNYDGTVSRGYAPSDIKLSKKLNQLDEVLSGDSGSKLVSRLSRTEKGRKLLADIRNRYRGMKLIKTVPQTEIGRNYASSDYVFALPGSTTAEYSSIRGQNHGGVIHLIPPEEPWAPRHFRGNALYTNRIMQPLAKSNIVSLTASDRGKRILDAVLEGGFKNWGRRSAETASKSALAPMVSAIKRDIALKRLARVGKLGLILTPAAVAGTRFVHRRSSSDSLEDRVKHILGKVKDAIGRITA